MVYVHVRVGGAPHPRPRRTRDSATSRSATRVAQASKPERLRQLVAELPAGSRTIVFCNTKIKCESLAREFRSAGTCAIHGDKDQQQREYALQQFTRGRCPMMFATDVAARGLDIKGVTNVINLDMPQGDDGVESYVHRIGRTGRAGATGKSHTLWVAKTDRKTAPQLTQLLADAKQEVPDFLAAAAASAGKGRGKGKGGKGGRSWGGRGGGKGGGGKGKGGGKGGKGGGWRRW